jgi:hypothetical protein
MQEFGQEQIFLTPLVRCYLFLIVEAGTLFSIDDNYKIVLAATFSESGNENFSLHKLQSKLIFLLKEKPLRPSVTMLR